MLKTEGYENSELFMSLTPKNGVKASKLYSYKPTNGNGDFVWSRNSTAYRMNQSGVLELMGTNVPRVDYSNTCPELLIEKASTNYLLNSNNFSGASWSQSSIGITSNAINAPDGNLTADKFTETATTSQFLNYQSFNLGGINTACLSVMAKKGEREWVYLAFEDPTTFDYRQTWFDLTNAQVGTMQNANAGIKEVNGYYLIWIVDTMTFSAGSGAYIGLADADNSASYAGTLGSGAYFWEAQVEIGDYPTSRIPTTTVTVNRPQDICYNTANVYADAAWSVVMRVRLDNIGSNVSEPLLSLNDGTSDVYFCIYTDSAPKLHFDWYNNPDQDTYSTTDLSNAIINIGVSYNSATAGYIIVIDGVLFDSGTLVNNGTGVFANFNRLDIGSIAGTGSPDKDGIIGIQYFNSALTQSDLENLTS